MKITVVMGGPSAEHEISLRSGFEVLTYLDKSKWSVRAVVIAHNHDFYSSDIQSGIPTMDELRNPAQSPAFSGPFKPADCTPVWDDCALAFLALHGEFGEDGKFQGYLDSVGIPYTGSGVYASAVGMNKITTKALFGCAGIPTPPSSVFGPAFPEVTAETLAEKHGFPCFVKCPQSGSSRLMGRASDMHSLEQLLQELSLDSPELLVESYIEGTEFSCPVLQMPDGQLQALAPVEIRPKSAVFFDYDAKYTSGATDEIVPIPHGPEMVSRIQQIALAAHQVLGCRGLSRTDMILKDDTLHVLEINTLPGMTSESLAPKSFQSTGRTYTELLDTLIQSGLARQ